MTPREEAELALFGGLGRVPMIALAGVLQPGTLERRLVGGLLRPHTKGPDRGIAVPAGALYRRGWGWLVELPEPGVDAVRAVQLGEQLRKALLPQSKVPAAEPLLHDLPLMVVYRGMPADGWVRIDPPNPKPATTRATPGLTLADLKRGIVERGDDAFGAGSTRITGSAEKGYTLTIRPTRKVLARLFRAGSTRAQTVLGLEPLLAQAIAQVPEPAGTPRPPALVPPGEAP